MIISKQIKYFILTIVIAATTFTAKADLWDYLTPYQGPDKDIITLVITSNYVKSKLLAELIQNETKQPYILLPSSRDKKIYFCPSRKKGLEIVEENLSQFIKFTNPKQIIILGDEKFVSEKYLKMIDKSQTVWVVSNKNWNEAASSIEKFLNLNNLARDFKRLSEEYDSGRRYKVQSQFKRIQDRPSSTKIIQHTPKTIETIKQIEIPIQALTEIKEEDIVIPTPDVVMKENEVIENEILIDDSISKIIENEVVEEPTIKTPEADPIIIHEKEAVPQK